MEDYYVLATNAHGKRHYFAGETENFGFSCIVITNFIFSAYDFATKEDAETCIDALDLGENWEISECFSGMSEHLKKAMP